MKLQILPFKAKSKGKGMKLSHADDIANSMQRPADDYATLAQIGCIICRPLPDDLHPDGKRQPPPQTNLSSRPPPTEKKKGGKKDSKAGPQTPFTSHAWLHIHLPSGLARKGGGNQTEQIGGS